MFAGSERPRAPANRSRRAPFARSTHSHDVDWNFTGTRGMYFALRLFTQHSIIFLVRRMVNKVTWNSLGFSRSFKVNRSTPKISLKKLFNALWQYIYWQRVSYTVNCLLTGLYYQSGSVSMWWVGIFCVTFWPSYLGSFVFYSRKTRTE